MRAILSSFVFDPGGQVSPILVRPVREQFEHDRVIRVLQARYKRKYEVIINPGSEQNASVTVGDIQMYPDLLLYGQERGRKLQAIIEVETTESINTLEAMAEWAPFSRLRVPFFLYVPPASIDTVRRLCAEYQVEATEIWTFHTAVDQIRFTMVHRAPDAPVMKTRPAGKPEKRPAASPSAGNSAEKRREAKSTKKPPAAAGKAAKPAKAAIKKPAPKKAAAKAGKRR
jgi:hypothetical protein